MKGVKKTWIWHRFDICRNYADKKQIKQRSEVYWNMFLGNQWRELQTGGEKFPVFNFIKPVVNYKVANVAGNKMEVTYSDTTMNAPNDIYEKLNVFFAQCWEQSKMDSITWKALKHSAIQRDSYCYWEDGDTMKPAVMIPNTEIFLGDENNEDIQKQPYIIIRERWSLDETREFARKNGVKEQEVADIASDSETDHQILNRDEVENKVTVLLYLEKDEEGHVRAGRTTKNVIIEPVESIKAYDGNGIELTALKTYPIVNYIWESVPFSARGQGEVEQLIDNQIELNRTQARRILSSRICEFPRLAYDANSIDNPEDLDKSGAKIAVNGGNAQSINQMVAYLTPSSVSNDVLALSAELLQTTKDLAGVTDYALGNINPENASGTAIQAVSNSSQIPLAEQVAHYKQWVEDIAVLWMDLWMTHHINGIDITDYDEETGMTTMVHISHEDLIRLKPTIKVDVTPATEWQKASQLAALDSWMQTGMISLEDYYELSPASGTPIPKKQLKKVVDKRAKLQQQQMQMQQEQAMMQQQEQLAQQNQTDPNLIFEELLKQGYTEDEAIEQMKNL